MNICIHEEHGGVCRLTGQYCTLGACQYEKIVCVSPAVPVDDMFCEMMNWAARYAIGRRTYAASDTANYILRLVDKLDDKTLNCLKNDIEKASSLGDDCDKKEWLNLLEAIKEELERRTIRERR